MVHTHLPRATSAPRGCPTANHPGFTLVELLVVVLVAGILAAIAVPTFLGQRQKAQDAAAISDLRNTLTAAKTAAVPTEAVYTTIKAAQIGAIEKGLTFRDVTAAHGNNIVSQHTSDKAVHVVLSEEVGGAVPYDASRHFFALRQSDSGRVFCVVDDNQKGAGIGRLIDEAADGVVSDLGQSDCEVFERVSAGGPGDTPGGDNTDDTEETPPPLDPVTQPACHYDPTCFSANAWGDPHIVTYDGLGYEFMTVGDYVFSQSTDELSGHPEYNVQIRTTRTPGLMYDWVTATAGVAAEIPKPGGGSNIVTYLLGDGLHINGNPVTLEDETPLSLDSDPSNLHASGYIVAGDGYTRIVWPGDEDLTISRPGLDIRERGNHLNIYTYLTTDYARLVEGVAGDPELVANPYNDLMVKDAAALPVPVSNHRIHTELAASWSVSGNDSLFERAGHPALARDEIFPERFTQNDKPPRPLDGVDPEDIQAAQDFCVEHDVHPNNVVACVVDYLAAGGDFERRDDAVASALEATVPTLVNVYDDWDYILDFEDEQAPPSATWARNCCGHYTDFAEYADDGGWVINENDTSRGGRLHYRTQNSVKPVGENFTLQAELQVTPHTDAGHPFKSTQFGIALADGTNYWKVIVGPAFVADGNAVGSPEKIYLTNVAGRKTQVRISKEGSVATLYVDGHEAFQLTPTANSNNNVWFGDLGGGADGGRVNFNYIAWASEAKGDANMSWWAPNPWAYGLDFSHEDTTPASGGWTRSRGGHYSVFQEYQEDGAWIINEEHQQRGGSLYYQMGNTVAETTTFQADVRIFTRNDQDSPFTSNSVRIQLADKTSMYQVILYPTSVYDPDSKKAYATDLVNRYAQIRIVRTPERATLYVDGHEAFDLQGSTSSNNTIAWGIFSGNPDGAKAAFDNIVISPRDLGTEGMKTWVPNGWLHTLNFDDGRGPEDHGWTAAGSLAGTSFLEDGRYVIEDTNPNFAQYQLYRLSNAVTENFTFQADIRSGATETKLYPYTINNAGLQISDGQKMYKVRIHPTYVSDGNRSENLPDNKYVTDLHSRTAQIRIAKNAAGAALYVDGQHAMDLVGVDTTTNEIAFGLLTNLADRTGRVEFDNIQFAAQDLSWMGMDHWKPNPWAHLLTFDDGQDPIQHGWAKNGSVNVTIEDGALVIDDTNPNHAQYNAYRFASAAADEMTVQADIKVGPATSGHAFNLTNVGLRIADGTTIWGARVHADRVEDRNDTSKSVSVDFTSGFHTVAISKTAGGAALYVDGQYAFDLTGAAGSTNEVVFGLVDNLSGRTGRAWFDNVSVSPTALP